MVERERPDVVLVRVDADHPVERATIDAMRAKHPVARLILLEHDHDEAASGHRQAVGGEDGPVVSGDRFVQVVARIRQVTASRSAEHNGASPGADSARPGVPALTRREHEILRLVALGNTNNEIAQRLGLAANTVKTYWQRALHKLSARNRAEAIARAHDLHLI
jgi:DNA-binding NarL/FixJ family response regulator